MKYLYIFSATLTMAACAVSAQTNTPPASSGSGLQLSSRTDEQRISFLMNVAQAYFKENDLEAAISAYERVLKIDPQHKEARYIISHVYINAKQYGKAETLLKLLISDYPDDFQLMNNLAWLYATADDPAYRNGKKAIDLAQKAMVQSPNDHHVWSTLSEAYYVSGEYEKAFRAINHMAALATRYGKGITKEAVEGYNEQIRKCKRAMDTAAAMKGDDKE
jgi:tetratricopeptide (TPR) repeat protein